MRFIIPVAALTNPRYDALDIWQKIQSRSAGNMTFAQFDKTAASFAQIFDWSGYDRVMNMTTMSDEVLVYHRLSDRSCDPNQQGPLHYEPVTPHLPHHVPAVHKNEPSPQGVVINDLITGKTTSASVSSAIAGIMALMAIETVSSIVTEILPRSIPPPIWNNLPLPCVPMVTGSNCFGAIIYPITLSDSILARIIDDSLDAIIQGFPTLFAERTKGKSYSFRSYQDCFKAYMSMHCASVFPVCTALQGTQDFMPLAGRMPICFHVCLIVLLQCPGFQFEDVRGPCTFMSPLPPPFCAFAVYTREDGTPPPADSNDGVFENDHVTELGTLPLNSTNVCPPIDVDQDLEIDPTIDDSYELDDAPTLDLTRLPILRSVE